MCLTIVAKEEVAILGKLTSEFQHFTKLLSEASDISYDSYWSFDMHHVIFIN